jgi:nitrate reductase alpha subunit
MVLFLFSGIWCLSDRNLIVWDANLMGSSCSFTAEFIQCISEANYLRGVANVKGVKGFGPDRGGKEKVLWDISR